MSKITNYSKTFINVDVINYFDTEKIYYDKYYHKRHYE